MTRLKKQSIICEDKLKIPEKKLRFATPEIVAIYRAERLKCEKLVEIGAGIGGQTFAFAKYCKKVLAVESNKENAEILIRNLKNLSIKNVEVLIADALSKNAVEKIKDFQPDIIFCDTERPEKGERTLEKIKPPIKKILETFSKVTSKIAIEIPPFTKDLEKIDYECEKEFISLNNELNRLTIYFNELKNSEISAISLPSKEKIINKKSQLKKADFINTKYFYLINPAVKIAGLIPELCEKFDAEFFDLGKPVLLSDKILNSDFLKGYEIISICKNDKKEILKNLREINAGKVVLQYKIEPKDYWKERNFYENQINGDKEISLFIDEKNNKAVLTKKLNLPRLIEFRH